MASEKEKKETELGQNRFRNDGQRRTLHAIDSQVERERRKVDSSEGKEIDFHCLSRDENTNMPYERSKQIFYRIFRIYRISNVFNRL